MNNKGFSTVLVLFLLPILVLFVFLVFFSQNLILSYSSIQNSCRDHSLKTQQVLAFYFNQILKLNPQATYLRHEEKIILIAMAAAVGNPGVLAVLHKKLTQNRVSQRKLRLLMESLLQTGELKAQMMFLKTYSLTSQSFAKNIQIQTERPKLYIHRTPPQSLAPNFEPVPFFEKRQNLTLKWSYDFINLFPNIRNALRISGSCSSTLTRKDRTWEPRLSVAKFY